MQPVKMPPPQPGLAQAALTSVSRIPYVSAPTAATRGVNGDGAAAAVAQDDDDGSSNHSAEDPVIVVEEADAVPPARETLLQTVLRLLVETANPRTTRTEPLTAAERQKQATFESLDYYKAYPAMYLSYLREKRLKARGRTSSAAEHASSYPATTSPRAMQPAPSLATSTASGQPGGSGAESEGLSAILAHPAMPSVSLSLPADEEDRHTALRWFLHVVIALSVGVVATVVSYAVDIIESYRADTLTKVIHGAPFRVIGYFLGFVVWLLLSVLLVAIAAGVVVYFEPAASGGGIPDVMAYLNGVHMPKALSVKTFVAKVVSCVCAVAGGLPVGLEAPLIHLGAITGAGVTQGRSRSLGFQTPFFAAFRNNKDRRDFITAGAACGVSAAFGAPIGGLLFVMEEVSSFWDHGASGQVFLATMICFTVTTIINSLVEDNRLLGWVSNAASVLFEVNLTIPLNLVSILPSLFLGALLGALAALFTKANLVMIKWRREVLRPYPFRRFLEPVLVALVYSTLMYTFTLLSDCRRLKPIEDVNETAHVWGTEGAGRLFSDTCPVAGEYSPLGTLNMATGKNTIRHLFTRQTVGEFPVYYLLIHFVLYFAFACVSSGMALSGGLVVPSLVIGAIFGRLYGLLLWYLGAHRGIVPGMDRSYAMTDAWMDPGVFALIGAGAFLAGTSRMAMSICVIMVELSSELHYLLPVMAAIVMSKTVADWLCEPLYHEMLRLDSVPYLSASLGQPAFEQLTAADVMATPVVVLRRREKTEVVLRVLRETSHHAFPVVVEVAGDDVTAKQPALPEEDDDSGDAFDGSAVSSGQTRRRSSQQNFARESSARRGSGGSDAYSPSRVRGLDDTVTLSPSTHLKFVGLVTREDLQVYLTLPQLKQYDPGVSDSFVQQVSSRYRGGGGDQRTEAAADGFGGQLAPCVMAINRMTWPEWLVHKASLFLLTGDRYEWVRHHIPAGAADPATTAEGTGAAGAGLPPVLDLTTIINRSPWVIPPSFNLHMAYHTFRTMGLRHLVVVDGDTVKGIITRKDLLVDSLRLRLKQLHSRLDTRDARRHNHSTTNSRNNRGNADITRQVSVAATSAMGGTGQVVAQPSQPSPPQREPLPRGQGGAEDGLLHELFSSGPGLVRGPGATRAGPPPAGVAGQQQQQLPNLLWDD